MFIQTASQYSTLKDCSTRHITSTNTVLRFARNTQSVLGKTLADQVIYNFILPQARTLTRACLAQHNSES